ncbi:hypothetical protein [Clostridium putrefaciens]|nr:hypothetical protein [Clostridium putrefaciens]
MVLNGDLTGDKTIEIIKDRYKSKITYDPIKEEIKAGDFERKEKYICE